MSRRQRTVNGDGCDGPVTVKFASIAPVLVNTIGLIAIAFTVPNPIDFATVRCALGGF